MKNQIIVFGAGSFAEIAHYYFLKDGRYKVAGFTVDKKYLKDEKMLGLPVVPFEDIEKIFPSTDYDMFVALGYSGLNKIRAAKYYESKGKGYKLISFISSDAICHTNKIGDNCFIFENNVLQPFVKIGSNVIIWSGNHIGHHSTIEDHCFISSHVVISGDVQVGEYSFLGVNSTIRNGIKIARETVIGAGALILKDSIEKAVYAGSPARLSKIRSDKLKGI
jgi:sugar O-acyltransferase (sialic acid O-acetyltransferase NeuD family)